MSTTTLLLPPSSSPLLLSSPPPATPPRGYALASFTLLPLVSTTIATSTASAAPGRGNILVLVIIVVVIVVTGSEGRTDSFLFPGTLLIVGRDKKVRPADWSGMAAATSDRHDEHGRENILRFIFFLDAIGALIRINSLFTIIKTCKGISTSSLLHFDLYKVLNCIFH